MARSTPRRRSKSPSAKAGKRSRSKSAPRISTSRSPSRSRSKSPTEDRTKAMNPEASLAAWGVVHLNIVVYAFAYWLAQPVFPFISNNLGADPIVFGYLQSSISILQLVGGPVMGRVVDIYGASAGLLISQTTSAAHYALLALSFNVPTLFMSQIPTLGMHAMHAAQTAVSILSDDATRAASLGRLSLSYGVGMICGSFIGGQLGDYFGDAKQYVALLSAALSVGTVFLTALFLHLPSYNSKPSSSSSKSSVMDQVRATVDVALLPEVFPLVRQQLIVGLGLSMYSKTVSQTMQRDLGMTSSDIGYIMSLGGIISAVTNIVLLPLLSRYLSDLSIERMALSGTVAALLAYARILDGGKPSWTTLLSVAVPLNLFPTLLYTVFSSLLTKAVPKSLAGTSLGLSHATRTLCGVLSPTLAGYLIGLAGFQAIGISGAALAGLGVVLTARGHKKAEGKATRGQKKE